VVATGQENQLTLLASFVQVTSLETGCYVTNKKGCKVQERKKRMAETNVKEVFEKVTEFFNTTAAQGLDAVFQFDITGDEGGIWNVIVKDGVCQVQEGTHDEPTVTLTMSAEDWLAMVNKELNPMQAFMSGQLRVSGDIMLAQRIPELFLF
jgi:putative sterol carrier protein